MEKLSIFVPNSFLAESKDSKIRTYKVGLIGRYAALFRANNIVIYNDNSDGGSRDDALYMKNYPRIHGYTSILEKTSISQYTGAENVRNISTT